MDLDKQAWVVGVVVRIKTLFGETIEVEKTDKPSASPNATTHNCRVLKTNYVKEVEVLSTPTKEVDMTLPPINTAQVRLREQQAMRRAHIEAARIGVGVTQEAQEIFNSLCKTLPCRWDKDAILVFEDIRIISPYGLGDVSGSDTAAVSRVKKVLDGERRKLGMNN